MTGSLNYSLLSRFSEFIASRTALHFPRERWDDLERQAVSAAGEFGFADSESFIQWVTSSAVSREQIEILASHLTISETYFWREPQVFNALMEHILPELVRSREASGKLIRIWSAGCSTGEEPYSIAIALQRVIPDLERWKITILATDINPRILRKANAGVYGEWSFRNAPPWLKDNYFLRRNDGKLEILPKIRKMVAFAYLNLAEDIYPSPINNTTAMDIIFCRNVLMYFAPDHIRRAVQGMSRSLTDAGWLIVSASELSQHISSQFSTVNFSGAIVYRKETLGSRPSAMTHFQDIPHQKESTPSPLKIPADTEPPALSHLFSDENITEDHELSTVQQTSDKEELNPFGEKADERETEKTIVEETPLPITAMIRAFADSGNLSEALVLCDKAISLDKLDPRLYYLRAVILQEQDHYGEAVTSLKHALYLDPNHALAYFTLGNLALRRGDINSAKRCFANALELIGACRQEDILPESAGLTAGRLKEILQATIKMGALS